MESALLVPVPTAEPVVGPWRELLDPSAALGVPAHITVMYPFLDPERIDPQLVSRLSVMFAAIPAFGFRLTAVRWFQPAVLWLAPEPSQPFHALTLAVMTEWPALKPYGGAFEETVPHLTVGETETIEQLAKAATAVETALPLSCEASVVALMAGSADARWRTVATLPLGATG